MKAKPSLLRRVDHGGVPVVLARLAVGGMFTYLSIMKLQDPINFLKLTKLYNVLPTEPPIWLNLTAIVMPYLELVCAIALLLGLFRRGAALLISGMLLFFTPLLVARAFAELATGKFASFCAVAFDCGCGTGEVFICSKLTENGLLLAGSLIALVSASDRWSTDAWLCRRSGAARAAPAAAPTAT